MAASESNFTDPVATGDSIANQWPDVVPALKGLLALWRMKYITGAEPSDLLNGLYFSDGTATYAWCIRTAGTALIIEENTGADAKHPGGTWTVRNTFSATTGLSLAASAITTGTFADGRISESSVTQHVGAIDHDSLLNFVADEHTDHSATSVIAGVGIDGGGTIDATVTLDLADTAVTPATYGDAVMTVDQQGRITAATATTPVTTKKVAGDQTVAGASTETDITELTALSFPSGTGSGETYVISATVPIEAAVSAINWGRVKLYVGTAGALADGATKRVAWSNHGFIAAGAEDAACITEVVVTPASGDLYGLSYESPNANTQVKGDNATHEQAYMTVRRVL